MHTHSTESCSNISHSTALKEGGRYEAVLFLKQTDQNSRAVSRHLQSLSEVRRSVFKSR